MSKNSPTNIKTLPFGDLAAFCEQFSIILKAGITTTEGLYIMEEETKEGAGKEIITKLIDDVEMALPFSTALENVGVFPSYMIHMVKIGEMSGKLDDVFTSLAEYYKKEEDMQAAIKHSVTYPMIMIVMMLIVIGVLVVQVMPVFNSVFEQLGGEVTGFSKTILDMGTVVRENMVVVFGIAGLILVAVALLIYTEKGRAWFKSFRAKFFLTRGIVEKIATARFANGMSLMLSSGLDTDESLDLVEKLVDNDNLREKIKNCRDAIADGKSFDKAISDNQIFGGVNARMLAVGFKTGTVDNVMKNISERYDIEVNQKLASVIAIIEPSLVAFLSVIVGAVLLSVMLPLMNIISQIG